VRSAFSNNLVVIQKIITGTKMAADAAAVFPPAIPGAALITAFTYVFQTFKDISADYERIIGFFTEMGSFLDRISMLESRSPKLGPFERCVRKVFTSMLSLSAIAMDTKKQGRFKKWLHAMKDGSGDPALAGAYSAMEDAIEKLGEAVGVATLRTAIVIDEKVTRLDTKTDAIMDVAHQNLAAAADTNRGVSAIREGIEQLDMRGEAIQTGMTTIDATVTRVEDKMDGVHTSITTLDATISRRMDSQHSALVSRLDALLKHSAPTDDTAGPSGKSQKGSGGKGDPAAKKHKALNNVRRHFKDGINVRRTIQAQRKEITENSVNGTARWILDTAEYKSWAHGEKPLLWLTGSAGIGKTHLAHAVVSELEAAQQGAHSSVAYFYFREEHDDLRSLRNALRCAVVQIAEKNQSYCDQVAADIATSTDEEPWKQFFAARYPGDSDSHLYLVLDGIDEALEDDQLVIVELFRQIAAEGLNIHVLFTARPALQDKLGDLKPSKVEINSERVHADIQKLIEARCNSLPRIRKFRRQVRKRIEAKLLRKADSMLYVEHMVRRYSAMGRESAVIKDLENHDMPDTLEGLYELMLAECHKGRSQKQYETLRTLFAMLAFSKRPLTLDEASDLIRLTDPDGTFDIEDEVIGRSARILELSRDRDGEDDDDQIDEGKVENNESSGDEIVEPLPDESGKTPLTFQERSLREYFKAINVEESGLRTPPAHAHLTIFKLLVVLLCDKNAAAVEGKEARLKNYAAHYWAHHFAEITLDQISNQEVAEAMAGLRRIFNDENDLTHSIEDYNGTLGYVSLETKTSIFEKLQAWANRARSLEDVTLDEDTMAWIHSWEDAPKTAVLSLARAHVRNWFTRFRAKANNGYLYAKTAFAAVRVPLSLTS